MKLVIGAIIGALLAIPACAVAQGHSATTWLHCSAVVRVSETQQQAAAQDAYTHWQVDRHAPYGPVAGDFTPWSKLSGQTQADWRNVAYAAIVTACHTAP